MPLSGGPLRSSLGQAYRVGREIEVDEGPVTLVRTGGDPAAGAMRVENDLDSDEFLTLEYNLIEASEENPLDIQVANGGSRIFLDRNAGGATILSYEHPGPYFASMVKGEDMDVALIDLDSFMFGRWTAVFPSGIPNRTILEEVLGFPSALITWWSGDATTPGPVFISNGVGMDYTYDPTPFSSDSVVVQGETPALTWTTNGAGMGLEGWDTSVFWGNFPPFGGGPNVDYDTAGQPMVSSPALNYMLASINTLVNAAIVQGDLEDLVTDPNSESSAVMLSATSGQDSGFAGLYGKSVVLGGRVLIDDQNPEMRLTRGWTNLTPVPNALVSKMGEATTGTAPGFTFGISEGWEPGPSTTGLNTSPFFCISKPVSGGVAVFGNTAVDSQTIYLGAEETSAHFRKFHFGEALAGVQSAFGGRDNGFLSIDNGCFATVGGGGGHDQLWKTDEEINILLGVGKLSSLANPYRIQIGAQENNLLGGIGIEPLLILTNTDGGAADTRANSLPGFTRYGNKIQAVLSPGGDWPNGGTENTAAVIVGNYNEDKQDRCEVVLSGAMTFLPGPSNRIIGASPQSASPYTVTLTFWDSAGTALAANTKVDVLKGSPDLDVRPQRLYVSNEIRVGDMTAATNISNPADRSRLVLRSMPDVGTAGGATAGNYGASAQPVYIEIESQDGTPVFLYIDNSMNVRASLTRPDTTATPGTSLGVAT